MSCFSKLFKRESIEWPPLVGEFPAWEDETSLTDSKPSCLNRMPRTVTVGAGVTAIAVVVAAVLITAYMLSPSFQAFVNHHIFTPLTTNHLPVWKGLTMIGLPIAGFSGLVGVALYAKHKWQTRNHGKITPFNDPLKEEYCLTPRQIKCLKVAAGVTVAALLILGAALVWHYVPAVQHGIVSGLQHKLTLGQSLLYIGVPVATAGVAADIGIALYIRHLRKQEEKYWPEIFDSGVE